MSIMDLAAWSLIAGLSFISVGGLLIWAYGNSMQGKDYQRVAAGKAMAARKSFTSVLMYSAVMIVVGLGFLLQGTFFLLRTH
jgi:hypothetical protein